MIQNAPINVVDYGADPTGVTVCSTEVQAAIDAGAGSNAIYFPAGTYLCKVTVPNDTTLIGNGWHSVLKLPDSSNESLISPTNTISGANNVEIRNLTIDGNDTNNDISSNGIFIQGNCINWFITECRFRNTKGNGIRLVGQGSDGTDTAATQIVIIDNRFQDTGNKETGVNGRDGIYINRGQFIQISNNFIIDSGRQAIAFEGSVSPLGADAGRIIVSSNMIYNPTSGGIDDEANNGGRFIIVNNYIESTGGVGIRTLGKNGDTVVANNNIFNAGSAGIDAENVILTIDSRLTISNNIIKTTVSDGIKVNTGSKTIVSNNNIGNIGGYGIYMTGDPVYFVKVIGNVIDTTTNDGIFCRGNGYGLEVVNNSVSDVGISGSQADGIRISSPDNAVHWIESIISQNNVHDTRGSSYMDYSYVFGDLEGSIISQNIARNVGTGSVQWLGSNSSTLVNISNNYWNRATWSGGPLSYSGASDTLNLEDSGVSTPATVATKTFIYVDDADGDLKVKFGDGTVKTIATDT
jgi:hypothetical protein|tara:strand:- start:60 stop:1625 length:1566 start_codon:yes stop_codon:yes gene_type:complete